MPRNCRSILDHKSTSRSSISGTRLQSSPHDMRQQVSSPDSDEPAGNPSDKDDCVDNIWAKPPEVPGA